MGFMENRRRLSALDYQEQHPLVGFFTNDELTDSRINGGLVVFGPFTAVLALAAGSWVWAIACVVLSVFLPLNYRRYRQRLFHALADRDRPPPPRHPDL